uniref:Polyprotein n=1 Tax=Rhopalosiphum padi virus TaxID=66834 RepID=A0A221LEK1_9VIRU|nr:polyprotein [Rhopalosiphum padi virus]
MCTMSSTNLPKSLQRIQQHCNSLASEPRLVTLPRKDFSTFIDSFKHLDVPRPFSVCMRWSEVCDNEFVLGYHKSSTLYEQMFITKYLLKINDENRKHSILSKRLFVCLFFFFLFLRTSVTVNMVYPLFKDTLNSIRHPANYTRWGFEYLDGTDSRKVRFLILMFPINIERVPLRCYKFSANVNMKVALSQLPVLMAALVNKERLSDQFKFFFLIQNFLHFFFRNLSYTNPTHRIEHSFIHELGLYCAKLVMIRPISTTEYVLGGDWDFDKPVLASKENWDVYFRLQTVAQIDVGTNTDVQMDPELIQAKDKIADTFGEAVTSLHSVAGVAVDGIRKKFACYLSICYNLYRLGSGGMSPQDVFLNVTASLMQSDMPANLLPQLRELFCASTAQSASIDGQLVTKLLALCSFSLMVSRIPTSRDIDSFILRLDRIPKAFTGLENMWKRIDSVSSVLWNWMEVTVLKREGVIPRSDILDSVSKWASELSRLLTLASRREIQRDVETLHAAGRMYSEGIRLMKQCKDLNLSKGNMEIIARNLPAAKLLLDEANMSGADRSKLRTEPLIVWFSGASGNGKSGLSYPFILDMMRVYGDPPETWQQNVYARIPETEYWDGYINQEYIIYDDFIQIKDSQLKPNPELFEMIKLGNMFPYQCHMASLLDKNNTFAEPKLICLTSNLRRLQIESLNCPEAVSRRIDYAFNVRIIPEYQMEYTDSNGDRLYRLDAAKARRDFGDVLCFDVYRFDMFDASSREFTLTDLTYTEMVELCQDKMRDRANNFNDYANFLESYRNKGVAQVEKPKHETDDSYNGETLVFTSTAQVHLDDVTNLVILQPSYMKRLYWNICKRYYSTRLWLSKTDMSAFEMLLRGDRDGAYDKCLSIVRETRCELNSMINRETEVIKNVFGNYWPLFKACAGAAIGAFSLYFILRKKTTPTTAFVNGNKELLTTMRREANKCLDNDCKDCKKCRHRNKDLCVKWYTKCHCYAKQMEDAQVNLKYYTAAAIYQEPERKKEREHCVELLQIVDQMCSCNCAECDACCDDSLIDKFDNVMKVYDLPCVCVCARLSQGFDMVEISALIKHCGKLEPTPILKQNKHKLSVKFIHEPQRDFERTTDYDHLLNTLQSQEYDGKVKTQKQTRVAIKYQSHDDNTNMKLRQIAPRVRYQTEPSVDVISSVSPTKSGDSIDKIIDNVNIEEQRAMPEMDKAVDTIVNHVVYPNTVYMTANKNDGTQSNIGHILFVCGQVALMPYHYKVALEERQYQSVNLYSRKLIGAKIPSSVFDTFVRLQGKDAMLVAFPVTVYNYKNIISHFVDIQSYPLVPSCPGILAKYYFANAETEKSRVCISAIGVSERDEVDVMSVPGCMEIVRNRDFYTYTAPTRAGDCGAALCVANTGIKGKIVGIHVSGVEGLCKGNSSAITKQMIELSLKKFSSIAQYAYPSSELTVDMDCLEESGSFVLHKYLPGVSIGTTMQTAIKKTPIHGQLIATPNKPGPLGPFKIRGEIIDPRILQRKKYGKPRPVLDQNIVNDIRDGLKSVYYQSHEYEPEYYKYPITFDQAILGIDGDPFINSLDRNTAPGFPYSTMRKGKKGKTLWFGNSMEYDLTGPNALTLKEDVDKLETDILNGKRPEIVWTDTLKDQKIAIAKANLGKTRLFSAAPMHYAIALRKICAPFIAHLSRMRIRNTICVGVNPFSSEWSAVAQKLLVKGPHVIAGDYSNFDGSLPAQLVYAATEIMADWYDLNWDYVEAHKRNVVGGQVLLKDEYLDYLRRLYYECVHHLHIMNFKQGSLMYYVRNGIPSGCPVTAPLNSIANQMALIYCWFKIYEGSDKASVKEFFEHTSSVFYGDDFVMNIRADVIDQFNQLTITEAMSKYLDMVMTDEAKTGECIKSRTLKEVNFLKRAFYFNTSIQEYTAPLDLTVILDSTNWYKIGKSSAIIVTRDTLKACLRELALHPEHIDSQYRSIITESGLQLTNLIPGELFIPDTRYSTLLAIKNMESDALGLNTDA